MFYFQIRTHSVLYEAENVLTPEVIKLMYNQRKQLERLKSANKTFQVDNRYSYHRDLIFNFCCNKDLCIRVPVLKMPTGGVLGCTKKNEKTEESTEDIEIDDWEPFWEDNETDNNTTRNKRNVISSLYGKTKNI